jgi:hypothetical protein
VTAAAILLTAFAVSAPGPAAGEHLLAGANHFRDGRYGDALVEFRVAGKLGAPDAARYAGAALVKLERFEDAVEAFGGGDEPGPDALVDYYRAVACSGARLYVCAERLLAGIGARSGPRIAEQAAKLAAVAARELEKRPSPATLEWYLSRCGELRAQGRATLATAYCREARALAQRGGDAARFARAENGLAELRRAAR